MIATAAAAAMAMHFAHPCLAVSFQGEQPASQAVPLTAATASAPAPAEQFTLTLNVDGWVPRLRGDVKHGDIGNADEVNLDDQFDLDNSEALPYVNLALRKGEHFQVDFSGFHFSTESEGEFEGNGDFGAFALQTGDPFRAEYELTSVAVELAYWFSPVIRMGEMQGDKPSKVDFRFGATVGMRYVDIDEEIDAFGLGQLDSGGEWIGVLGGLNLQMRYELPESFPIGQTLGIDGSVAVGPALGGEGGGMIQIEAGLSLLLTQNLGLSFGYRLIQMDVEEDDYQFTGGLAGLFLGGSLQF